MLVAANHRVGSRLLKRSVRFSCCFLLFSAVLSSAIGCGPKRPPPPPQMTISLHSTIQTNGGQLFYLLMRTVNEKQFLADTYQGVADLVFADPPDSSVLGTQVIFPGLDQTFKVVQPVQNSVGFYFLFTNPGDQWKRLVSQPLANAYVIDIDGDRVDISVKQGFFRRHWPF